MDKLVSIWRAASPGERRAGIPLDQTRAADADKAAPSASAPAPEVSPRPGICACLSEGGSGPAGALARLRGAGRVQGPQLRSGAPGAAPACCAAPDAAVSRDPGQRPSVGALAQRAAQALGNPAPEADVLLALAHVWEPRAYAHGMSAGFRNFLAGYAGITAELDEEQGNQFTEALKPCLLQKLPIESQRQFQRYFAETVPQLAQQEQGLGLPPQHLQTTIAWRFYRACVERSR
jgi:hypothetical protein